MIDAGWIWAASLVGLIALAAGLALRTRRRVLARGDGSGARIAESMIHPDPPSPIPAADEESLDVWGFRDTRFLLNENGRVEVAGGRYELSGCELPHLAPWVREVMGVEITPDDVAPSQYPPAVPEPRIHEEFLAAARATLGEDQINLDPLVRLRHGHGHTQAEMYAIKYGALSRVPDLVVYPADEAQVVALVEAARRHDVCLIPYGGGTNVSDALRCPKDEQRTIVSLDLQRMNRILWIDPVNRMACIEAGAVGRCIMEQLESYGFTMGHEPDSVEFSTLGGWIATNASGMKKNRYGNIEDLVLDVSIVTPDGTLERTTVAPRESVGLDPRRWIFGSEGSLGIITRAVVKIFSLPEVQRYGSIVFPSFEDGVAFMYDLSRTGDLPASVRLVDNVQFGFSMALKPRATGWRAVKSRLQKKLITRVFGFDPKRMVACTLVFEGGKDVVARQQATVYRLGRRHGGMKAGSENGRRGYQLTFRIAYIRDFVMQYQILGESFETSVSWSRILELCENVRACIYEEYEKRGLPGRPFFCSRVTQIYRTGVCVYFYFGFSTKGVDQPSRVYAEIEVAARAAILRSGGSLSHHHGVGKIRQRFLPEIMSPAAREWARRSKQALDPTDIFAPRNQGL